MNIYEEFEKENHCFGTVTWDMSDLDGALEEKNIPDTKDNLSMLYDSIDVDDLKEAMIQAGWNYIYGVIRELAQYGDLKTN